MEKKLMDTYTPPITVAQLLQLCTEEEREQIDPIITKVLFERKKREA